MLRLFPQQVQKDARGYTEVDLRRLLLRRIAVGSVFPGQDIEKGLVALIFVSHNVVDLSVANEYGSLPASFPDVDSSGFPTEYDQPDCRGEIETGEVENFRNIFGIDIVCVRPIKS